MKTNLIYKGLLWLMAFTASLHAVFVSVVILLTADLLTGIWASIRSGEKITSNKLWNTGNKIILYNLAVIVSFVVETYLFQEIPWVRIVTGFIAMTELQSFYENICKITGKDIWSYIKEHINQFKKNEKHEKLHFSPTHGPAQPDRMQGNSHNQLKHGVGYNPAGIYPADSGHTGAGT